jgi:conjugal transfer ATP-binding protein TraC
MGNPVIDQIINLKASLEEKIFSSVVNNTPPLQNKKKFLIPSLKELQKLLDRKKLSSLLPYESYDEENGIYYNKDNVGIMLLARPATGLNVTDLKILNGLFSQSYKPQTSIQISLISDTNIEPILENWAQYKKNCANSKNNEIFDLMSSNRVDFFKKGKWKTLLNDQPYLVKNYHLIISITVPFQNSNSEQISNELNDELKRIRTSITGTLRSARIYADLLKPEVFINLMNGILNPSTKVQPRIKYDENQLINRQMVDENSLLILDSGVSSLKHQDETYSIIPYHVRQFPQAWAGYQNRDLCGSFFNNILRLNCPSIMTLTILIPDQLAEKSMVKRKFTRATQMSDSPVSKYAVQWKERKRDWDYTSQKVEQGDKLLKAFYQIILITPEGHESDSEQSLISLYESLGWILSKSRYIPVHAFLGALPMGLDQEAHKALLMFGHYMSRLSWTCTNVAPWIAEWKGTETPMMLFTGRRGQLTYFNPFDNNKGNFNISCSATAGSGKSFFTQEWIFSALGSGGRAFVIDAGHSYRNLCHLLNGTYIDFGEGKPNLNPFSKIFDKEKLKKVQEISLMDESYGLKDYIDDFMPMLKELLGQMCSPQKPLDEKLSSLLEKALNSATLKYQEETTITKVAQMCLELKDENQQTYKEAQDLALMLHPYTKEGMYGKYFEGKNNIDLDNAFVVLELDALNSKGNLQAVVLLILMIQINQVMYLSGNRKQVKQVVIDEAWRLLGSGRAGSFIEEGYRVARKHGGSYMTVTQKVSDYFSSQTAQAAFMNSDFVVYLRQKPEELSSAEKKGYIDNSDGKIDILKSLETIQGKYSELCVSSPDGISVLRFSVDPITEKIYSTKAQEVDFIHECQKNGKTLLEAVELLIKKEGKNL